MFHTFETNIANSQDSANGSDQKQNSRRTSTVRACEPCRRRKIRCNGEHPCETCQWYRKADTCHYTEPRQRQVPSRRSIEKISATLQEYRGILQQLFPSNHPDSLTNLPREKLLELINHEMHQPPSPATSHGVHSDLQLSPTSAEAGPLEVLQTMPEEEASDGSDTRDPHAVPGISDDVNALSLSIKQTSSYLGISSVMAVLRVILWIDPECQPVISRSAERTAICSRAQSPPPDKGIDALVESSSAARHDGIMLLNAYFTYVHTILPLIEEQSFRETYISGRRHDSRWLALLNMVFAMGSIAAFKGEDTSHSVFYRRAKRHLGFDCLGSAHLETIQTLAIMGGYYLHYIQQPNLANSIMGAALRMAVSLGLHREYDDSRSKPVIENPAFSVDMRRRIWWSIFNLDTLAGMTLGRPSMGRWGHAITTRPPVYDNDRGQGLSTLALKELISFCRLSTSMQDVLAISPIVPPAEAATLDAQMVAWFDNLPELLRPGNPCPESIATTRNVMRWWYYTARIVLHRPVFLSYAMRRIPFTALRMEERVAIEKCRFVAAEAIGDISTTWRPNQMSGWNALWLLYQASMVPLLSLFSDSQDVAVVESSSRQIEQALDAMAQMEDWSQTAKRSYEVVSRIYQASRKRSLSREESRLKEETAGVEVTTDVYNFNSEIMPLPSYGDMDIQNMWDSLNWSSGLESLDYPFNDMGNYAGSGWDYGGLGAGGEGYAFEAMFSGLGHGLPINTNVPPNMPPSDPMGMYQG